MSIFRTLSDFGTEVVIDFLTSALVLTTAGLACLAVVLAAKLPFIERLIPGVTAYRLLATAGLFVVVFGWGWHFADARSDAKALRAQLEDARESVRRNQAATADANKRAATLAAREAELQKKADDYERELAKRPVPAACRVTPDDAKRLRRIR